ncbi:conserved protein of unknown function [Pseudomonas marincola]|uniref:Uncharacterized protein n=1 Tax=Pseudomonas marincola TaxID=437900 RepID=A0A653E7B5_9PSED|nr:conserved protein of unknown function [Pseudomonas marincola]
MKQRNPSGNRKINPNPAPDNQTVMSEAASGFQPPRIDTQEKPKPEDG